jgi:hypothetical protein
MWVLTISGILLIHLHYYHSSRNDADQIAKAIIRYKAEHGYYPQNLKAAGIENPRKAWMIGYFPEKEKPGLFYAATFLPFDTYFYDFDKDTWSYHPD